MPPKLISGARDAIYAEVRKYLLDMFEDDALEVVKAYQGNNPPPASDYISMWMLYETSASTTVNEYDAATHDTNVLSSSLLYLQLDCYGSVSEQRARIISSLWHNHHAADRLINIAPAYVQDTKYTPLIDGKDNYLPRWSVTVAISYNPIINHSQEYIQSFNLDVRGIN